MTFEQAIEVLMRRGKISRHGKTLEIRHGIVDVTDPERPERADVTEEDRMATDWEEVSQSEVGQSFEETVSEEML